ncbi:hypothetical protein, partial [Lyngbya sp. CCY1209]|uniref:hypothetical protein n=1 Tax=Lyngbya sp. CCY1209 TaxID=2886103 RepID=UPI002D212601
SNPYRKAVSVSDSLIPTAEDRAQRYSYSLCLFNEFFIKSVEPLAILTLCQMKSIGKIQTIFMPQQGLMN